MKNGLFIYHKGTRLGRIAKELKIPVYYPTADKGWFSIFNNRTARLSQSVNWGSLRHFSTGVLNSNAINAAKKVRAFKLFNDHNIPCPEWDSSYDELNKRLDRKRTIFARKDGLSGGAGISIISPDNRLADDQSGIDEFDFFVSKIPYHREYRLHVWQNRVIIEQVKFIPSNCENPIHNHENGCKFSTVSVLKFLTKQKEAELQGLCIKACEALNLDFGAVDIIQDPSGKFWVLEINTAPGIKSLPVERAYGEALKGLIL